MYNNYGTVPVSMKTIVCCSPLQLIIVSFLSQEYFTKAKELAKLTFELTGALGKRTKFQGEDIAQLLLQVTSDLPQEDGDKTTPVTSSLPKVTRHMSIPLMNA